MVYREDNDLRRQDHRGDCGVISLYELYYYVLAIIYVSRQGFLFISFLIIILKTTDNDDGFLLYNKDNQSERFRVSSLRTIDRYYDR